MDATDPKPDLKPDLKPDIKIVRTFLSARPGRTSRLAALSLALVCTAASAFYWDDIPFAGAFAASRTAVFDGGQWWRLFTATFAHSDFGHLLSNSYMLVILAYFVHGHFGGGALAVAALPGAALVNLLAIASYHRDIRLVGASGLVYLLAGFWLAMYVAIERQRGVVRRLLRAAGVGLMILFPTTFEPHVSYRSHAIGFALGILFAAVYFGVYHARIRAAEEVMIVAEDPA
jgi:rhomboid protease GluP